MITTREAMRMTQVFIFALMIDAAVVCVGLAQKRNMWAFIVVYWAILTLKNAWDFVAGWM